ncbi:MAG: D-TA family PLP-dependent enzyme [Bacteroidales bacterium]|nr:D-TA family PLP-dependent enzyme [Bacteroidales bacterium]
MSNIGSLSDGWYTVSNAEELLSPALIVYPDRIEQNIRTMISIAGDVKRLRPHVKTHKMAEIIRLQMSLGISRFKCATVSEVEMVAGCGADDILLACQPVGPDIGRFFNLRQVFPKIKISCLADTPKIIHQLSLEAVKRSISAHVWLDINCGMNRTGVTPGDYAANLFRMINSLPMLDAEGLHVYDGHIHESGPVQRAKICEEAFAPVSQLAGDLRKEGNRSLKIIAGGTPTFPVHARREGVELSPGTTLLWDHGYGSRFSDMDFLHAAVLITRVISKPAQGLLCLDLGHKAVASEMPQPRVIFPGLVNYEITGHNEEHMVVRTTDSSRFTVGDMLYGIPHHICPTVDRYDSAYVARNGKVAEEWKVAARRRKITI